MVIDEELCIACGQCVPYCPVKAITLDETACIDLDECVECGNCLRMADCPVEAISRQELEWPRTVRSILSDPLTIAAESGISAIGIDRNRDFLAPLRSVASRRRLPIHTVLANLESPAEIPIGRGRCGVVLVFRYLHRPLARAIAQLLAPGGLLVYETFTTDQTKLGYGPQNPDFLLEHGELCGLFDGLEVLEHWEGIRPSPRPAALARLVARAPR